MFEFIFMLVHLYKMAATAPSIISKRLRSIIICYFLHESHFYMKNTAYCMIYKYIKYLNLKLIGIREWH